MSSGVLVLNASYEPLRVISIIRAITLLFVEESAVLEEAVEGKEIKGHRRNFPVPSVIRLKHYVKIPHKAKAPLNTRAVLSRDEHTCAYCGKHASTVDHVIPRSRGGKHEWTNVVAACKKCNAKKDDKLLSEIGWELRITPQLPRTNYWVILSKKDRERWAEYIPTTR